MCCKIVIAMRGLQQTLRMRRDTVICSCIDGIRKLHSENATKLLTGCRLISSPARMYSTEGIFFRNATNSFCSSNDCGLGRRAFKTFIGASNSDNNINRKMSSSRSQKLVTIKEAHRFMIDCFKAANTSEENAVAMADLLIAADYRGHYSHGMNRLEMYINDLQKGACDGKAKPKIIKATGATAWVDGQNALGAVVGNFCMDLAIQKAKECGVGWVCARHSNHYGIAGWYSLRAMKEGMIGISMTNTSPLMAPTRSKSAALGTNPLAVGAPSKNNPFLLDMATTAVAVGKIEMQRRKGEPIPKGWAQGPDGQITTDPEIAFEKGCLMPLGGAEQTSGYKGYGLGAVVDILSGVCSGANYSTKVRKWTHAGSGSAADLGQVFIATNPNCFAPNFEERLDDFNSRLRGATRADPDVPVFIAGDKEALAMKATDKAGGIQYLKNQWDTCEELAKRLNVSPLKPL